MIDKELWEKFEYGNVKIDKNWSNSSSPELLGLILEELKKITALLGESK